MQNSTPQKLKGLSFSPRQQELLRHYSQQIKASFTRAKDDIRHSGNGSTDKVDAILKKLNSWMDELSAKDGRPIDIEKGLAFLFVEVLQKDIDPMISIPDSLFTHIPRQDSKAVKIDASFYELLHLYYIVGASFIRHEGVEAAVKLFD